MVSWLAHRSGVPCRLTPGKGSVTMPNTWLMDTGSKKFIDTAAIIKYLDLVITTDTSIAHLAGTLGTQTWLLLPKVSDWRWFNSKDETIWYDNFRIYRQKVQGDWSDVFAKVEKDCQELIKNISDLRNT